MWSLKHKWPKASRALDGLTFYGLLANLPLACCGDAIRLKCLPSLRTLNYLLLRSFSCIFHIYAKLAYFAGWHIFSFLYYVAPASGLTKSMPVINGIGMIKSNQLCICDHCKGSGVLQVPVRSNTAWDVSIVMSTRRIQLPSGLFTFKPAIEDTEIP